MNPYENLPDEAFWRTAIATRQAHQISNTWKPKFQIRPKQKIATAGSCFAQHISKALVNRGYSWLDGETAPEGLSLESQASFNYGVFSFRTGNIYTAALLKQWTKWALRREPVPDEVWSDNGRFYDPFRPNIEPNGFFNIEELKASREGTLQAIRDVFEHAAVFVFTLGLTEAWVNTEQGYVYPMCPGTVAGEFNAEKHKFINYSYPDIRRDLRETLELIKGINPKIKFLLTVSPVPLTATASNTHVLVATTYSKSTLRAVAGDLASTRRDVDYFPSYELITGFPFRGMFYKENLRSVSEEGVNFVMSTFFTCLGNNAQKNSSDMQAVPDNPVSVPVSDSELTDEEAVVCEEELLAAFAPKESLQ